MNGMQTAKEIYSKHWAKWCNETFKDDQTKPENIDEAGAFHQFILDAMQEYASRNKVTDEEIEKQAIKEALESIDDSAKDENSEYFANGYARGFMSCGKWFKKKLNQEENIDMPKLKQPDQKLFKKVYIKTEADLPGEDGEYFVITKAKNYFDVYNFNKEFSNVWLNHITAYLLPVKQVTITNEEIDKEACRLSERTDSNGKTFIDAEYYDGFNDGAKWRRDKLNNE